MWVYECNNASLSDMFVEIGIKEDLKVISAVVLVNTDIGAEDKILDSVRSLEGVKEAHVLTGLYDLLLKVTASSIEKLKEIIKFQLRQLAGVTSVLTLMIIEAPSNS